MPDILNADIRADLANYISRNHYSRKNLETRTKNWFQRKHKIKLTHEETEKFLAYFQGIYEFVKQELPKYTKPSTTGFASPEFVDGKSLQKEAARKYNQENLQVLNIVIGWVVYFEYLR